MSLVSDICQKYEPELDDDARFYTIDDPRAITVEIKHRGERLGRTIDYSFQNRIFTILRYSIAFEEKEKRIDKIIKDTVLRVNRELSELRKEYEELILKDDKSGLIHISKSDGKIIGITLISIRTNDVPLGFKLKSIFLETDQKFNIFDYIKKIKRENHEDPEEFEEVQKKAFNKAFYAVILKKCEIEGIELTREKRKTFLKAKSKYLSE